MAKAKTESVRAREARLKAEAEAKAAAEAAAELAAQEAARAAEEARAEVERRRAAKAAPKPKRPRFVRPERAAKPEVAAVATPAEAPPSQPAGSAAGKVILRNLRPLPKAAGGPNRGPAVPREKRQVRHEGVSRK